jgi:hypothetical protein
MKKLGFGIASIGAALTLLGACSSDAKSADVGALNNFLQAQSQAACDWEFKCCTDAEIKKTEDGKYTTSAQCLAYQQLTQEDQLYLARLAVSEGRLKVDSTHAAACLQTLSARVCNPKPGMTLPPITPTPTVDDCALALVGNTAVGSECIYAQECVLGAHCVEDMNVVGRGVCVPYQKVGDICNVDGDCDPSVEQIYCATQDFKCHVRGKLGDTCAYTTTPPSTMPSLPMLLECDQTPTLALYCDPATSTCKNLPGDGQPCLQPLPPGVNDSCNPDPSLQLQCTSGTGTGPGIGGTCRAPGKVGDDCTSLPCETDLYCDTTGATPTCATLPGLGLPCAGPAQQCAKPFYCSYSAASGMYTCAQPAALGQDCSMVTCDTGLYCNVTASASTCAAQLPDGSPCLQTIPNECESLYCGGSPTVCQPSATGIVCTGR